MNNHSVNRKTVKSRLNIGFPTKENWIKSPAQFTPHTLRVAGHPVMESWEQGYMDALADIATKNGGTVLEVGYGMGISASAIQNLGRVSSHFIIEAHPGVARKFIEDFADRANAQQIHLITGFWEDVTGAMADNSFDGILFDTYPLSEEEIHSNHFWFFKEAHRLLKPGGVLTYYSDEALGFSKKHMAKLQEAGFSDISGKVCEVAPPKDCEYWTEPTLLAPIIRKTTES